MREKWRNMAGHHEIPEVQLIMWPIRLDQRNGDF